MKLQLLKIFSALILMVLLPVINGNASSSLDNDIKVFTYYQTCNCYMLVTDDGGLDDCEWFVNGTNLWNNGKCD